MPETGLGAVLSEVQSGKERMIAYAAHALSKPEANYIVSRVYILIRELMWM